MDIMSNMLYMIPVATIIAFLFGVYLVWDVFRRDKGTPEMQEISNAIKQGAMAYLGRQYRTIGGISILLALIIGLAIDWWTGFAFLIGAFFSALSGFIGMYISVNTNIRTAAGATRSLKDAFQVSFRGGAVSGIAVATISLVGVFVLFTLYNGMFPVKDSLYYIIGYAFGASFAALFAQLGGGIYTKAADIGADLVGKVEAGIPEDDPRNPAVIADLVGDNVGDCAGRGADLFESTAAEIIGSMILGLSVMTYITNNGIVTDIDPMAWVYFPLVLMAFGLIASIVGIMVVRLGNEDAPIHRSLNIGYYVTVAISLIFLAVVTQELLKDSWTFYFGAGIVGMLIGIAIVYITQYYTAGQWRPVKEIAEASKTGPATNIITGISLGLETTLAPVIVIIFGIMMTFTLGLLGAPNYVDGVAFEDVFIFGIYGTAVGTISMLTSAAFILAEDTFGPITDNAGGIVEMSDQPTEVRDRTDKLDSAGNTTKALTKGYAMASAALAAFLLFSAYFEVVASEKGIGLFEAFTVNVAQPQIFIGALLGAMLVFLFASLAIRAVGKAAFAMINEVRRQFREIPGLLEGKAKPEYDTCVDLATKGALKAMILPGILPVVVPVGFGLILANCGIDFIEGSAWQAVGALLISGTITGILMANFFNNGGGAWDNAKKFIEEGNLGGKGSETHAAAVVGDTVGDPFKDTAGPSIHVLIKLLATITLVFATLFIA